ncbi:FMN-binding protein [Opitutales bacterium]|nr:FMN-binding protein [Opitutales bacterium]
MRRTRHFCRFICLGVIVGLIHQSHQDFLADLKEKGQPIGLKEVREILPQASSLQAGSDKPSELQARDSNEKSLGLVTQTSPAGDSAIGFSGSTNLLVIWDGTQKVSSVSIRSSGDTLDHVDAILEEPDFFKQFVGKTRKELSHLNNVEAVSGATLTSMAIVDAISMRFGGEKQASRFPNPIRIEEVADHFPSASELIPSATHPSLLDILDANGSKLGQVGRSSPHADQIIGYQGPVDSLLILETNGTLKAMAIRSSFENQPYADYPNDDAYFASLFTGRSIPKLADMNLTEEEVEGVSGATMTSMAMAKGIVKTASSLEQERLRSLEAKKPLLMWKARDYGSLSVILLAGFVAFTKRGKTKFFRISLQVLLVCYLGLVNGDILSQALFAGWAQSGVPWERAPILALLSLAALLVPMATGKAFYCHQLCPHGAAQQWMRKLKKIPLRLPKKLDSVLQLLPTGLLALVVFLAFTGATHTVAILEPFDAYVWEVAGGITIAIALVSLIASAFVPMAYCRYGCPTGAVLKLFEFKKGGDGWNKRDYLSFTLLGLTLLLYFFF